MESFDRRSFMKTAGLAGSTLVAPGLLHSATGSETVVHEIAQDAQPLPSASRPVKFAVCGMSHDHIYGMVGAIERGGGTLVAAWGGEPDKIAGFKKRYPNVKMVATQDEIVHDPAIELVLSSQIANERAPLGVRCMKARQGLPLRQARHHHARAARRRTQDHRRDQTNLRASCTANGWR